MGWLKKIFKGSSHRISEGKYHDKYGNDRVQNEASSSLDALSACEDEDLDHAIALSLSEEEQRKAKSLSEEEQRKAKSSEEQRKAKSLEEEEQKKAKSLLEEEEKKKAKSLLEEEEKKAKEVDNVSHLEEDELLAMAIQESLIAESPPRENGHNFQPMPFSYSSGFRICAGCNTEIGHGRFLSCMGAVWHPECFRCHACNQPISEYEFSMYEDHPYHKSCYRERHQPKCDICKQFIPANRSGLIEYRAHPFWLQKYCPSHELDGTPRCCSCERMEPRDTKYITMDDGRKLCLECLDSSIMDTSECQPLYLDMRDFYEGLNMKVGQQIPLLLVERQALNEAMVGEKNGHHHLAETRGLCLSEEQIISTVLRKPRIGAGNRIFDMVTGPYRLTRHCEVTAILILYGLPRLLTGSILAHELMHAWLRLNGYRDLSPEVEEGICQVLAHMWLDSEIVSGSGSNVASSSSSSSAATPSKKGPRSQSEKRLGEFFKHQIESDTSSAYGDGFRAGDKAVLKYGLRSTLDHIKMTGSFPC
ncbi:protein DA1-related 1-like [Iris pallida]|uniref:Protein DA1-related 1-like n=1 Tax=Iris pallida TaxID=29817 RepID=A0AAX6I6Y9_IRIPA|nr:protein DA1-related 1-like [Iris pallida]